MSTAMWANARCRIASSLAGIPLYLLEDRMAKVEVGEVEAAVDVDVIVEYGEPIADDAKEIRTRVRDAVGKMTGLEVVEINMNVLDVSAQSQPAELSADRPRSVSLPMGSLGGGLA
ncbi:Asp23/Gls24 family envelope stress response protein [Streptomyces niveus]|uniref:Asp23/Gls24 family envelope stress response protein n=1 Tax=Streptomyces niveus TaxID=193462 RepID=UPI00365FD4B0